MDYYGDDYEMNYGFNIPTRLKNLYFKKKYPKFKKDIEQRLCKEDDENKCFVQIIHENLHELFINDYDVDTQIMQGKISRYQMLLLDTIKNFKNGLKEDYNEYTIPRKDKQLEKIDVYHSSNVDSILSMKEKYKNTPYLYKFPHNKVDVKKIGGVNLHLCEDKLPKNFGKMSLKEFKEAQKETKAFARTLHENINKLETTHKNILKTMLDIRIEFIRQKFKKPYTKAIKELEETIKEHKTTTKNLIQLRNEENVYLELQKNQNNFNELFKYIIEVIKTKDTSNLKNNVFDKPSITNKIKIQDITEANNNIINDIILDYINYKTNDVDEVTDKIKNLGIQYYDSELEEFQNILESVQSHNNHLNLKFQTDEAIIDLSDIMSIQKLLEAQKILLGDNSDFIRTLNNRALNNIKTQIETKKSDQLKLIQEKLNTQPPQEIIYSISTGDSEKVEKWINETVDKQLKNKEKELKNMINWIKFYPFIGDKSQHDSILNCLDYKKNKNKILKYTHEDTCFMNNSKEYIFYCQYFTDFLNRYDEQNSNFGSGLELTLFNKHEPQKNNKNIIVYDENKKKKINEEIVALRKLLETQELRKTIKTFGVMLEEYMKKIKDGDRILSDYELNILKNDLYEKTKKNHLDNIGHSLTEKIKRRLKRKLHIFSKKKDKEEVKNINYNKNLDLILRVSPADLSQRIQEKQTEISDTKTTLSELGKKAFGLYEKVETTKKEYTGAMNEEIKKLPRGSANTISKKIKKRFNNQNYYNPIKFDADSNFKKNYVEPTKTDFENNIKQLKGVKDCVKLLSGGKNPRTSDYSNGIMGFIKRTLKETDNQIKIMYDDDVKIQQKNDDAKKDEIRNKYIEQEKERWDWVNKFKFPPRPKFTLSRWRDRKTENKFDCEEYMKELGFNQLTGKHRYNCAKRIEQLLKEI